MKRVALLTAVLLSPGCVHVGTNLRREPVDATFVFPRDDARSMTVQLETNGDVAVEGGPCSLVQARVRYDANRTEPSTEFEMGADADARLRLAMANGQSHDNDMGVCVSTELPVKLDATVGRGNVELDLSGVQLRGLETNLGTGDLSLDLGDASVAQATMVVNSGTGDVTVDAKRSVWTGTNSLEIDVGTGDVTVLLPRKVGLRVTVDRGTGSVAVRGLESSGEAFVNTLADSGEAQLEVRIDSGLGDITVIAE